MAKKNAAPGLLIRSLADGPRDYPLRDGTSVYLPPRGRGVQWTPIPEDGLSEALTRAERKGLVEVRRDAPEAAKEASE